MNGIIWVENRNFCDLNLKGYYMATEGISNWRSQQLKVEAIEGGSNWRRKQLKVGAIEGANNWSYKKLHLENFKFEIIKLLLIRISN